MRHPRKPRPHHGKSKGVGFGGTIKASATLLPSQFFGVLQTWFDPSQPGGDLLIKITAGEDEQGARAVVIRAEAEAIGQSIFTLLNPVGALKLADTLEQLLPLTHDATKVDVYSGVILALREAAKDPAQRRSRRSRRR
jgi:hypothetical protein